MPPLWQILLIYALGMAGILYVITILPGKRKNKQVRAGDTVTLLIDENTGTTMKVIIYAIQSIVEKSKT